MIGELAVFFTFSEFALLWLISALAVSAAPVTLFRC